MYASINLGSFQYVVSHAQKKKKNSSPWPSEECCHILDLGLFHHSDFCYHTFHIFSSRSRRIVLTITQASIGSLTCGAHGVKRYNLRLDRGMGA